MSRPLLARSPPPSALSGVKRGGRCHVPRAVCHPPGGCSRAPSYGKRALLPSLPPSHGARVGTGTWELMPGSSAPPDLSRIDHLSCLLARPTSVLRPFGRVTRQTFPSALGLGTVCLALVPLALPLCANPGGTGGRGKSGLSGGSRQGGNCAPLCFGWRECDPR